jgi:hypothetical protein
MVLRVFDHETDVEVAKVKIRKMKLGRKTATNTTPDPFGRYNVALQASSWSIS